MCLCETDWTGKDVGTSRRVDERKGMEEVKDTLLMRERGKRESLR
jgi:hypothetical protein